MKKILIAITTIACSASLAYAESSGFYIGGQIGGSLLNARNLEKSFIEGYDKHDEYFSGGKVDLESVYKMGATGGFNFGYNFQPAYNVPIRTELSFRLRSNLNKKSNDITVDLRDYYPDLDPDNSNINYFYKVHQKNNIRMNTLMLNAYYDIYTNTPFTPFVGIGAGFALSKLEGIGYDVFGAANEEKLSKSNTKFAWDVAAGIAYKLSDKLDLEFTAHYINAGKITAKSEYSNISAKLNAIDLLFGARYNF